MKGLAAIYPFTTHFIGIFIELFLGRKRSCRDMRPAVLPPWGGKSNCLWPEGEINAAWKCQRAINKKFYCTKAAISPHSRICPGLDRTEDDSAALFLLHSFHRIHLINNKLFISKPSRTHFFFYYSHVQQLMPSLYPPNVFSPARKCIKTICLLDGGKKNSPY